MKNDSRKEKAGIRENEKETDVGTSNTRQTDTMQAAKKTQDLTTMNERVCIVRGERDEGRERSKRDTELRRFALCTHSFPWRLTRSVVSCRILRCKHRRRSYQATRERYSRKAWNDIGSDGTYTHTHTRARSRTLSPLRSARATRLSLCPCDGKTTPGVLFRSGHPLFV